MRLTIAELNEMIAKDATDWAALDDQVIADTRAYNLKRLSEMAPEDQAAAMQKILEEGSSWLNWARF